MVMLTEDARENRQYRGRRFFLFFVRRYVSPRAPVVEMKRYRGDVFPDPFRLFSSYQGRLPPVEPAKVVPWLPPSLLTSVVKRGSAAGDRFNDLAAFGRYPLILLVFLFTPSPFRRRVEVEGRINFFK